MTALPHAGIGNSGRSKSKMRPSSVRVCVRACVCVCVCVCVCLFAWRSSPLMTPTEDAMLLLGGLLYDAGRYDAALEVYRTLECSSGAQCAIDVFENIALCQQVGTLLRIAPSSQLPCRCAATGALRQKQLPASCPAWARQTSSFAQVWVRAYVGSAVLSAGAAEWHWRLGRIQRSLGDTVAAGVHLDVALALYRKHCGHLHPSTRHVAAELALLLQPANH